MTCLLWLLRSSSQLSRASVTFLLGVELVLRLFRGVKCVDDVLAGLGEGIDLFFGVKCVGDVLAGLRLGYFFVGVKCVDDLLAGVLELFVLVKGVGDVLA